MRISNVVREGLRLSVKSKSLWLFGFFLGLGSSGSGGGAPVGSTSSGEVPGSGSDLLLIALLVLATVIAGLVMHFVSEGAVIEGVRRVTRGETLTIGEGFREGRTHVVTILLIKLAYIVASAVGAVVLAVPCLLVAELTGLNELAAILGILAVVAAAPLLVTLYIWHAFALRIAVLENRRTGDAIRKARLILHGRLLQGLKLMIAALLGTLVIAIVGLVLIAPLGLLIAGLAEMFGPLPIVLGLPLLLPAAAVVVAIIGTYQSSVWTIGYLQQVEA
jgi:type IV secretory pathway VirB3-like protein